MILRRQPIFVSRIPNSFLSDTYIHKFSLYCETGQRKFETATCMDAMSKPEIIPESHSSLRHISDRRVEHFDIFIPELPVNARPHAGNKLRGKFERAKFKYPWG